MKRNDLKSLRQFFACVDEAIDFAKRGKNQLVEVKGVELKARAAGVFEDPDSAPAVFALRTILAECMELTKRAREAKNPAALVAGLELVGRMSGHLHAS